MGRYLWYILVLFVFFGSFLAFYFRADIYLRKIFNITVLPRPLWGQAYANMFDDAEGKRGILARATENGLWIWRGFRLNYIQVDKSTAFSYWQACETLNSSDGKKNIDRFVTADYDVWKTKIDVGRVVVINYLGNVDGAVAREVLGYDWKTYLPLPATLEMQCQN